MSSERQKKKLKRKIKDMYKYFGNWKEGNCPLRIAFYIEI